MRYYSMMVFLTVIAFVSFTETIAQSFTIDMVHYNGEKKLALDTVTYTNSLNQTYTINRFKYYVSNIVLTHKNGKKYTSTAHFLVNEADDSSKQIVLPDIPRGDYTQIAFTIGVDSMLNTSGVQTGTLDPMNGMFWTWNTGYIFLKLEGKSPASPLPAKLIEYHIGGFKEPANAIRKMVLPIHTSNNRIQIKADIATLLNGKTAVDFTKLPSVTDLRNATTIADNYAFMFSVLKD